jgi:hypothetical protein
VWLDTLEAFTRDGVVVLPQFCTPEEVAKMKGRMAELIDQWDPAEAKVRVGRAQVAAARLLFRSRSRSPVPQGSVFHTYGNEKLNQDYFLESAATVKFFLEAEAVHKVCV